jgi:hypothetical protein
LTKLRPSRQRFANRGKKRGATVISFQLSRPVQILLVVKGPGPSCERVGRGRIAGRAGLNRVRFDGTVRNVPLKPGMYRLDARLRAGGRLLGSAFVTIIDPRSPLKRYVRPECSLAKLAAAARPPRGPVSGLRDIVAFTEIPAPVQDKSPEPAKPRAAGAQSDDGERAEVLGELTPPSVGLTPPSVGLTPPEGGDVPIVLELVLLLSVIGLLIGLASGLYVSVRRGRRFI